MKPSNKIMILAAAVLVVVATAAQVLADPLPGQVLKFQQLPMDATSIAGIEYWGHDEISTIYGSHGNAGTLANYVDGRFMADDFADEFDTPVVHIRWWGSYISTDPDLRVRRFLISFEEDVPVAVGGTNFSHPGNPILSQVSDRDADGVLTPGSGTFTEKLISGGGAPLFEALYEYNAELACPFDQQRDDVTWLKIVALVDPSQDGPIIWGWHNRDYTKMDPLASVPPAVVPGEHIDGVLPDGTPIWHFQDDAVSGDLDPVIVHNQCNVEMFQAGFNPERYIDDVDGPGPLIGEHSKDLAFELYTIPEPTALILVLIGTVSFGLGSGRRRRR